MKTVSRGWNLPVVLRIFCGSRNKYKRELTNMGPNIESYFREPNGITLDRFQDVWENGSPMDDGTRLPSAVELLATKENTGRDRDSGDWSFLIAKTRSEHGGLLARASTPEEASKILNAFFDYEVCRQGLKNPRSEVRELILAELADLVREGDPFAEEIINDFS
ncbi:MAG: hypothetical protein L3J39_00950 [Verrucomicrobiales bacterium]|nr:hypothetical protein [Verrucomicrobiales bacterium]